MIAETTVETAVLNVSNNKIQRTYLNKQSEAIVKALRECDNISDKIV